MNLLFFSWSSAQTKKKNSNRKFSLKLPQKLNSQFTIIPNEHFSKCGTKWKLQFSLLCANTSRCPHPIIYNIKHITIILLNMYKHTHIITPPPPPPPPPPKNSRTPPTIGPSFLEGGGGGGCI